MSNVPTIDDTTHGAIHWFKGYGPRPVTPYAGTCDHWGQGVVAYGWDLKHYELVECGMDGPGNTGCRARAWSDGRGRTTTPWMVPDPTQDPEGRALVQAIHDRKNRKGADA